MDYSAFIENRTGKSEGKGKLPQLSDILDKNKNGDDHDDTF